MGFPSTRPIPLMKMKDKIQIATVTVAAVGVLAQIVLGVLELIL
jgi:hypothetical protein